MSKKIHKLLKCYRNKKSDCHLFSLQDWTNEHNFSFTYHHGIDIFFDDRNSVLHNHPTRNVKITNNDIYTGICENSTKKFCINYVKNNHYIDDFYMAMPVIGSDSSNTICYDKPSFPNKFSDLAFYENKKDIKV